MESLATGLMWDSPLTMLRLDHNLLVDDNAVRALCSALRNKRTLKQLSLGYCGYSSAGAESIAKLLLLHTGEGWKGSAVDE